MLMKIRCNCRRGCDPSRSNQERYNSFLFFSISHSHPRRPLCFFHTHASLFKVHTTPCIYVCRTRVHSSLTVEFETDAKIQSSLINALGHAIFNNLSREEGRLPNEASKLNIIRHKVARIYIHIQPSGSFSDNYSSAQSAQY